jgi:EAL domain-containing protein (putative c-di-GMP-specific phosphodiesterase class I)
MIGPGEIIRVVEEARLHVEFDRWVVGAICRQAKKWRTEGVPLPVVAANVWSETLRRPDALRLIDALAESGVDPKMIEIECPRGSTVDPDLIRALAKIQSLGVRLASEELVTAGRQRGQLNFDTLKIPFPISREYVAKAKAIAAVVAEAKVLDARVVADSVESIEQEEALASLGVRIVQGYLYGPEVAPAELHTLITRPGVSP